MEKQKKIIIIGAGPGGLTAAMVLANRGFNVHVYEKDSRVGGRNQAIEIDGYKFDTGPTFLMMKFILDEVFHEAGKNIEEYLDCQLLDPMYRLQFDDQKVDFTQVKEKMYQELEKMGISK
ncbi:FAD-dependent oxidoreductase, partial [Candidatus Peregrinibacteria bacterium]|nr:FAD-dependent oxidoreductase [Candidatus Peregrinibacteria bacterium]